MSLYITDSYSNIINLECKVENVSIVRLTYKSFEIRRFVILFEIRRYFVTCGLLCIFHVRASGNGV